MSPKQLDRPLYTYAEADHLAGVSRGTARRWLAGYRYRDAASSLVWQPPVTPGRSAEGAASFLDLVEVAAIGGLKEIGFSLPQIRNIVVHCQQLLNVPRPLTSLRFKTDGREMFVDRGDTLLEVGRRKGQEAWTDVLQPFLQNLDYNERVVRRWWPFGHDGGVFLDPDYAFGLPVIAGSGVRTEIILEQFRANESVASIARDFNVTTTQVEQALRFEVQRAA
jgi:uncharacterized protein (DUF433 family)